MYQELRDAWRLERASFRLQRMDPAIYRRVEEYLAKLTSGSEGSISLVKKVARMEAEVLRALAQDLFSLRVRKALAQALEGRDPLPYLTREEAEAVSTALKALSKAEEMLVSRLLVKGERVELKLVRLLREVSEEEAPSLGPLRTESLALLPIDLAERLVKEGYAELID